MPTRRPLEDTDNWKGGIARGSLMRRAWRRLIEPAVREILAEHEAARAVEQARVIAAADRFAAELVALRRQDPAGL